MAFPLPQGTPALTQTTNDSLTLTPSLPTGIVNGEMLVAFVAIDGATTLTVGSPVNGWVKLGQFNQGTGNNGLGIFYKLQADGTDALTISSSVSESYSAYIYRVSGHSTTEAPTATFNGASTNLPNPAAHTPPSGAQDYLWFTAISVNSTSVFNSAPSTYGNLSSAQATAANNDSIGVAYKTLNASSDDPATWSLGTSRTCAMGTMAIAGTAAAGSSLTLNATESGKDTASFDVDTVVTATVNATESGKDSASFDVDVSNRLTLTSTENGKDTASFDIDVVDRLTLNATEASKDTAAFNVGSVATRNITLSAMESGKDSATFDVDAVVRTTLSATENGKDTAAFQTKISSRLAVSTTESGKDTASFDVDARIRLSVASTEGSKDTATFDAQVDLRAVLGASEVGKDTAAFNLSQSEGLPAPNPPSSRRFVVYPESRSVVVQSESRSFVVID